MRKNFLLLIILFSFEIFAQNKLEFYLNAAYQNNPAIIEQQNLININSLQKQLDYAQNSGFQMYLSANYLFAPYFNN
ncbi:MAG: hypothetical protein LDL01_01090, partial [Ignavibacterium sp.]|nr:hypothetical protein [Ignavibacterium sp.]